MRWRRGTKKGDTSWVIPKSVLFTDRQLMLRFFVVREDRTQLAPNPLGQPLPQTRAQPRAR